MDINVPEQILNILSAHREIEQPCGDHNYTRCSCGANYDPYYKMPQEIYIQGAEARLAWRDKNRMDRHIWKFSYHIRQVWNEEIVPLGLDPVINECPQSYNARHEYREPGDKYYENDRCVWCKAEKLSTVED